MSDSTHSAGQTIGAQDVDAPHPVTEGSRVHAIWQAFLAAFSNRGGHIQLPQGEQTETDALAAIAKRRRRRRNYCICAVVLTCIFSLALLGTIILVKRHNAARYPEFRPTYPGYNDGTVAECLLHQGDLRQGWQNAGVTDADGRITTSISVDLDTSGGLYFITDGNTAWGTVSFVSANKAQVEVEVSYPYDRDTRRGGMEHNTPFSLCHLLRQGSHGIGLYMPISWSGYMMVGYEVKMIVSLPNGEYSALETSSTRGYTQDFTYMPWNNFRNVTLAATSGRIHAEKLRVQNLSIRTEGYQAKVSGSFAAAETVDIGSPWGTSIEADITLGAKGVHEPQLRLQTGSAVVRSTIHLVGSPRFIASASTTGGPLRLDVASLPVNATLNFGVSSMSDDVHVRLPSTFEGTVFQQAGKSYNDNSGEMPRLIVYPAEDPAGLGRNRISRTEFQMDIKNRNLPGYAMRQDVVGWGGSQHGFVAVHTSNGNARVDLVDSRD